MSRVGRTGCAHQEFLHQVLSLLVKPLRKRILKLLNLLPVCKPSEDKTTRDHLIDDATQSPKIRTATTTTIKLSSRSQQSIKLAHAPLAALIVLQKLRRDVLGGSHKCLGGLSYGCGLE